MNSDRILLAVEFKKNLNSIVTEVIKKIKSYDGEIPVPIEMIELGVTIFNIQCPERIIETFIQMSFPDEGELNNPWDFVKSRDEAELIKMGRKMVLDDFSMFQSQSETVLEFILANRQELLGDIFEEKLWNNAGELIKIAILYSHLRRHPHINSDGVMRYTSRFAPRLSIKKEAEKWEVKI